MNMEFNTINECKEKILSKKISILELNQIFINRIKNRKNINSLIFFDEDLIKQRCNELAKLYDKKILKGKLNLVLCKGIGKTFIYNKANINSIKKSIY